MAVLVVKNISREGPGILEELLRKYNLGYDIVDLEKGEKFPNPNSYKAVFVFGGPDSANDNTPMMTEELLQVRKAVSAGIPYLGACLGMQVLVKANGGKVVKSKVKEVGWKDADGRNFEIELSAQGRKDPLFNNLKSPLRIFHLHGESVELTDSMVLLATGKHCTNQVVKIGNNAYGLQGHFELTSQMFSQWIRDDPDLLSLSAKQLEEDYKEVREEYEATGKQMLTNFLKVAKLV